MRVKENLVGAMSAVIIILGAVGVANAQTETKGAQGLESVDKNLNRDPDNRGLTNAQKRIEDNMADRQERKADKAAHVKKDHADKAMRAEKAERADKADRPQRPDRPERAGRS